VQPLAHHVHGIAVRVVAVGGQCVGKRNRHAKVVNDCDGFADGLVEDAE